VVGRCSRGPVTSGSPYAFTGALSVGPAVRAGDFSVEPALRAGAFRVGPALKTGALFWPETAHEPVLWWAGFSPL
jgi:hypothetical protein